MLLYIVNTNQYDQPFTLHNIQIHNSLILEFPKMSYSFLPFIICNLTYLDTAYFFVFHPLDAEARRLFFPAPPAAFSALHLLKPQQHLPATMTLGCTVVVVLPLHAQLPHLTKHPVEMVQVSNYIQLNHILNIK